MAKFIPQLVIIVLVILIQNSKCSNTKPIRSAWCNEYIIAALYGSTDGGVELRTIQLQTHSILSKLELPLINNITALNLLCTDYGDYNIILICSNITNECQSYCTSSHGTLCSCAQALFDQTVCNSSDNCMNGNCTLTDAHLPTFTHNSNIYMLHYGYRYIGIQSGIHKWRTLLTIGRFCRNSHSFIETALSCHMLNGW